MVKIVLNGTCECEVGGVYHICYYSPTNLQDIINNKGKDKTEVSDGRIFPYIAHYLTTGDLIYPAHEGEGNISSLLEELNRLNLVRHLFHQTNSPNDKITTSQTKKYDKESDCNARFKIRPRNERLDGVGKVVAKMFRFSSTKHSTNRHVYRPPLQNKGHTIVIVKISLHGKTQIKVHGPWPLLESLLPEAQPLLPPSVHHPLNGYVLPAEAKAQSVVTELEEQGFVVTVRSSWAETQSGALTTQWLLFRKSSMKILSSLPGGSSKKASSLSRLAASTRSRETTKRALQNDTLSVPYRKNRDKNENSIQTTPNQDYTNKSGTLDRLTTKWNSLGDNLSNTTMLSRSLMAISGKETYSKTLPSKKNKKNAIEEGKKETILGSALKTPSIIIPSQKEKSKVASIWNRYSKVSLKKVIGGFF